MKEGDRFLLAGKKRAKNRTSNYLISMDKNDLSRNSGSYLGKLRSNFIGTEFVIYDKGVNPKDANTDALRGGNTVREELGCCMYVAVSYCYSI